MERVGTKEEMLMETQLVLRQVKEESETAWYTFPAFHSYHEGLAIIEEEFLELRAEVFKQHDARDTARMRQEAIQLAAMAVRFVRDLL